MNVEDLTLTQAAAKIRAGRLSPVVYVRSLLARIDRLDSRIQAWVTIDRDRAIQDARQCETEARAGHFRGPLHGVPIGIKDIFHTQDLRTTAGSRFLQDFVPTQDAHCVTELKRSGAIVLGKTVTTEFATYDPGPTHNPWNLAHTPGGSSSGSAAAVAARMCPAALGSQTVGSIGRPAAYCGVVGFMPTQSRVSRAGVFPVSWSLDHIGGLVRSVDDANLLLEALAGESIPVVHKTNPYRLGVVRQFFRTKATPEIRELHEATLQQLSRNGFELKEIQLPAIFEIHASILVTIQRCEMAAAHREFHHSHSALYGRKLRALVETGMIADADSYLRAKRLRKVFQSEMERLFENVDVLISPGAMDTAPHGLDYTGDPGFSGPWTLADFPTVTIPSGLARNGMPVGLQISAPPLQESLLFAVARELEPIVTPSDHPSIVTDN